MRGDFDGDGKTDLAVYRPSTGTWYILKSSNNYTTFMSTAWGVSTDIPIATTNTVSSRTDASRASDYDGDGKADITVFRPSTGTWRIAQSSTNYATSVAIAWPA